MAALRALGDRIIVEPIESPGVSKGGLFIPEAAKDLPIRGTVLSVGMDVEDVEPMNVVLFGKFSGLEITEDGEKLLVLREEDILAVVDEE